MSSRLGLDSVPTRFVDDCYHHLLIDKKDDIMWLREVVDEAKNEEGYYCEADEAQMPEFSTISRPMKGLHPEDNGTPLKLKWTKPVQKVYP
ncbi:hypothetical protein CCMSSC00406_0006340 [Pleurotus cornucopiae]|uniref:Uncharacterized protein n=1 Tax=Pleurotus cornucopiae TaxID=5321 RepID=A0ACB7IRE9_PLECO|nr:hypothetical protein CCMSSC00406_0006340 [Pleurotus cornucopiae]